jgi:hypothetical protein
MIHLTKILKKYKDYKLVPIQNYEVLASIGMFSDGVLLLPNSVAQRYKKLKLIGKKDINVEVCLIFHVDRPKTKTFLKMIEEFKKISKKI